MTDSRTEGDELRACEDRLRAVTLNRDALHAEVVRLWAAIDEVAAWAEEHQETWVSALLREWAHRVHS